MPTQTPADADAIKAEMDDLFKRFLNHPNNGLLSALLRSALDYKDAVRVALDVKSAPLIVPTDADDVAVWSTVKDQMELWGEFNEIRVEIDAELTGEGVYRASGLLGYALSPLKGDRLGDPRVSTVIYAETGKKHTVLEYDWDSASSERTNPNYLGALANVALFLKEGSPVRKTDRAGVPGTRLVKGLGGARLFGLYVR
jgi:hypothetical protein